MQTRLFGADFLVIQLMHNFIHQFMRLLSVRVAFHNASITVSPSHQGWHQKRFLGQSSRSEGPMHL